MMIISHSRSLLVFLIFISCVLFAEAAGRRQGPPGRENHSNYVDREFLKEPKGGFWQYHARALRSGSSYLHPPLSLRSHIKEHLKNEHAKNAEHAEQPQHSESLPHDDADHHETDEYEDINVDEMDENEELYYLFSLHDYNHDGYLDGHELRLAFTDFDEQDHGHTEAILDLAEVEEMVDHALEEDDIDGDGKISMEEYIESETYHMI